MAQVRPTPGALPGTLFLASGSPRRHQLIRFIHPDAVVVQSTFDEPPLPSYLGKPASYVRGLALEKARHAVLHRGAKSWVLGADTLVHLQGKPYGKPKNERDARRMLTELSGRRQTVITGVALWHPVTQAFLQTYAATQVTFRDLSKREISDYLAVGEWSDKAGSYAAQGAGAALIERVSGCWTNVVGLPVAATLALLREAGEQKA